MASTRLVKRSSQLICEHCNNSHSRECWRVTGACFGCGSKEHLFKDCAKKIASTPTQTERSAPTSQRNRKFIRNSNAGNSQRAKKEIPIKSNTLVPARCYGIEPQEEQGAPDIIIGTFSLFDSSVTQVPYTPTYALL